MNKIFDPTTLDHIDLEGHILHPDSDFNKVKYAFIALGQGGGKLAVDFNRLGNYVTLFNTATEDLNDAEKKLREINNGNYKITKFRGFDGSKKDRNIGLKAVRENIPLLKSELISDEKLSDADFVWIVAALGGGTGSGSITDVVNITSNLIRYGSKRLGYEENEDYITVEGKPTVGVIAIIPDDSSGHRIKLNAAEALQELQQLQSKGVLGSILLVDNQKLIENTLNNQVSDPNLKWHVKGNASIASLLTEVTITSSIPSEESFDKSELLDIFSEPGYLAFSKYSVNKRTEDDLPEIVMNSFKSQIFADGYNLDDALISSLLLIKNETAPLFSTRDELNLKSAVEKLMSNVRYIHYGIYEVKTTLKYIEVFKSLEKKDTKEKERAIIYTMSIMKNPPSRVIIMTKEALNKRGESECKLASSINELETIGLKEPIPETLKRKKTNHDLSIESILNPGFIKQKAGILSIEELLKRS